MGIGVSIGIALGQVGAEPDRLLSDADLALYQAKAAGRNYRLFHPELQQLTQPPAQPEVDLQVVRIAAENASYARRVK